MDLCSMSVIKPLLERHGFSFNKSIGQNFLIAGWVPERIAELSGADKDTSVLEVGPGVGCLTVQLAKRACKVAALELDKRLLPVLAETLGEYSNTVVIQGDLLKTNLEDLVNKYLPDKPRMAVANLPYYITSPAITALMESGLFDSITVMVQEEVAQKVCARPGTKSYAAISVYVAYYGAPEILFKVPAGCFSPAPKVTSAVLRINLYEDKPKKDEREHFLFQVIRSAFEQRRKTLLNALSSAFANRLQKDDIRDAIKSCGIHAEDRGEALGIEDFVKLAEKLFEKFGST